MSSVVLASLALTGSACAAEAPGQAKASAAPQATPKTTAKAVVYYFHGTFRCATCRRIEAYADEAVKAAFAAELAKGEVQWRPLNIDEPANGHFVDDYQLVTRSLVVVDGSNPKRFKNLEKVWTLVGDKPVFLKYVQDEVRAFRKS
jgi:hypothetical protein